MFKRLWRKFIRLLFVGGTAAALLGGTAYADDRDDFRALKEQLEAQKKQIEDLQKQLGKITEPVLKTEGDAATGLPAAAKTAGPVDKGTVEQMIADYLKRQDEQKKSHEAAETAKKEEEGYKVGSDLKMGVRWNTTNGLTFETANKDFVSHIGVRFQVDDVFWSQGGNSKSSAQLGNLQDGTFFRRVRPSWDGQAWEVMEWNVELALEQVSNSVPNLDECWVGIMNLPAVGAVRAGHIRVPQGFEGDMYSSSKAMTFLERSMYTDAFYQNFASGVWTLNSIANQRITYAAAAYRQDNDNQINQTNNAVDFNEGAYAFTGRLTALPIWDNNGRCLLHLGASYTYRDAEHPNGPAGSTVQGGTSAAGPKEIDFRARPQMRDAIGDYGNAPLSGNSKRIVDTGPMASDDAQVIGTEFFYVRGPFSVQAEYAWAVADNARSTSGTNLVASRRPIRTNSALGSPWFDGGYIEVSYFLTGENRTYDRRLGRLGSTYIASPYTPFYLTRGEEGGFLFGRGAWEVAARWNHLDLDSGLVNGGISDALELGLNWYLNTNMKVQFEYLWQDRYHLKPGLVPTDINGFGIRTQFFF